jgi:hypothetical protein
MVGSYVDVLKTSSARGALQRKTRAEYPERYQALREPNALHRWEDDGGDASRRSPLAELGLA